MILAAVAVRVAIVTSVRPLGYDDGVYAMSVMAMRAGAKPFVDVFSSQGPVFLPILRLFDIIGFEQPWAPRLAMVAAGIGIGLGVYAITEAFGDRWVAAALAVAATTSIAVVFASGPLESDGIALAFTTVAVAVAARGSRPVRTAVTVGVLGALALATKSLLAVPPVLAAVLVLTRRHRPTALATASAAGLAAGLLVTLPFGVGAVWDQYVRFHLDAAVEFSPLGSLEQLWRVLIRRDRLIVGIVGIAIAWWALKRGKPREDRPSGVAPAPSAIWVWLVGSIAITVLVVDLTSGNIRYVAFIVVPLALLVGVARLPAWLIVTAIVVLLPVHILSNAMRLDGRELKPAEQRAVAALEALPAGSVVVTDAPSLAFAAGVPSPAWLTDTSYVRIWAGYLTMEDLVIGLSDPDTCAVLIWSGRLDELEGDVVMSAARFGFIDRQGFDSGELLLRRSDCGSS